VLNLISNLVIKHYLKVSIFDEKYLSVQQRFIKIHKFKQRTKHQIRQISDKIKIEEK